MDTSVLRDFQLMATDCGALVALLPPHRDAAQPAGLYPQLRSTLQGLVAAPVQGPAGRKSASQKHELRRVRESELKVMTLGNNMWVVKGNQWSNISFTSKLMERGCETSPEPRSRPIRNSQTDTPKQTPKRENPNVQPNCTGCKSCRLSQPHRRAGKRCPAKREKIETWRRRESRVKKWRVGARTHSCHRPQWSHSNLVSPRTR